MKYRKVGKSGLVVSEIALGSWLTYGNYVEKQTALKCLETAVDHGVNFIDSAEIYAKGKAESLIGEFLKRETVERDNLVLSSKVFWPMTEDINRWGLSRKNIKKSIRGSLKRLGTDYLDIYYMHRYDYTTPIKETIQTIGDLIQDGKIHYWGTSSWTAAQIERAVAVAKEFGVPPPIAEQPLYNMLFRHIELEIMKNASNDGIGITVFSPLAQGVLTGKYNNGVPEDSRAKLEDTMGNVLTDENLEKVKKLTTLAEELETTLPKLALAWILRRKEVSCAIVGASSPDHVEENIAASEMEISEETLKRIEDILDNEPQWPGPYAPNIFHKDDMR